MQIEVPWSCGVTTRVVSTEQSKRRRRIRTEAESWGGPYSRVEAGLRQEKYVVRCRGIWNRVGVRICGCEVVAEQISPWAAAPRIFSPRPEKVGPGTSNRNSIVGSSLMHLKKGSWYELLTRRKWVWGVIDEATIKPCLYIP